MTTYRDHSSASGTTTRILLQKRNFKEKERERERERERKSDACFIAKRYAYNTRVQSQRHWKEFVDSKFGKLVNMFSKFKTEIDNQ